MAGSPRSWPSTYWRMAPVYVPRCLRPVGWIPLKMRTRRRSLGGCGCLPGLDLELAFLQALSQHLLVELAHARLGHLVDEGEVVGHLPLGHAARQVLAELLGPAVG